MAIKRGEKYYRMGREVIVTDFARNPRTGLLIVIYRAVDGMENLYRDYDEFKHLYSET